MGRPTSNLRLRILPTLELTDGEIAAIRQLMTDAFGTDEEHAFTDDDWAHTIGGLHFVLDLDGQIVTHASVVERELHIDGQPLRTGYVEAVATAPAHEGVGHGSQVMEAVTAHIRARYELGGLGTGRHHFYERLGWLHVAGASLRSWTGRPGADDRGGGLHPGAADPDVAAVRAHRVHQLRVAYRRRLVNP